MNDHPTATVLKCLTCGATLVRKRGADQLACTYCGTEHTVTHSAGTTSLRRVVESISKVQAGTDRTAAELSLVRLNAELATVQAALTNPSASLPPVTPFTLSPTPKGPTSTLRKWAKRVFAANALLIMWIIVDRSDSYSPKHPELSAYSFIVFIVTTVIVFAPIIHRSGESRRQQERHIAAHTLEHVTRLKTEHQRIVQEIARVKVQLGASLI